MEKHGESYLNYWIRDRQSDLTHEDTSSMKDIISGKEKIHPVVRTAHEWAEYANFEVILKQRAWTDKLIRLGNVAVQLFEVYIERRTR